MRLTQVIFLALVTLRSYRQKKKQNIVTIGLLYSKIFNRDTEIKTVFWNSMALELMHIDLTIILSFNKNERLILPKTKDIQNNILFPFYCQTAVVTNNPLWPTLKRKE